MIWLLVPFWCWIQDLLMAGNCGQQEYANPKSMWIMQLKTRWESRQCFPSGSSDACSNLILDDTSWWHISQSNMGPKRRPLTLERWSRAPLQPACTPDKSCLTTINAQQGTWPNTLDVAWDWSLMGRISAFWEAIHHEPWRKEVRGQVRVDSAESWMGWIVYAPTVGG